MATSDWTFPTTTEKAARRAARAGDFFFQRRGDIKYGLNVTEIQPEHRITDEVDWRLTIWKVGSGEIHRGMIYGAATRRVAITEAVSTLLDLLDREE